MRSLRRSPGATMRFLKRGAAVLVLVGAIVVAHQLLAPDARERGGALRAACWDTAALAAGGMLRDARGAYEGITNVAGDDPCPPRADSIALGTWLDAKGELAAREGEKARAYFEASRLERSASIEAGRKRAVRRARRAYIRSLGADPTDSRSRADLRKLLVAMRGPRDAKGASRRCRLAGSLRTERLLDEALIVYAQALRTGLNRDCVRHGLRALRDARATAAWASARGAALTARGHDSQARAAYLLALLIDPAATDARAAIGKLPAPDARATLSGSFDEQIDDVTGWTDGHWRWLIAAGVALLLLGIGLMWLVMLLANHSRRCREALEALRFDRYTRIRYVLPGFSPSETAAGAGAVFGHYLSLGPIDRSDPASDAASAAETPSDMWEGSEPTDALDDVADLMRDFRPTAGLAALPGLFRKLLPRHERRLGGTLIAGDDQAAGLRLLVMDGAGHSRLSRLFWADCDLPGGPWSLNETTEAHVSLAITAATWTVAESEYESS